MSEVILDSRTPWKSVVALRRLQLDRVAVIAGAFVLLTALAAAQGGYFPPAWGWAALGSLWAAAIALSVRTETRIGTLERVMLAGLIAFTGWVALSSLWASTTTWPIRETERALLYVASVAAAMLVVRRSSYRSLLAGVWAGATIICAYSLSTRLFPDSVGTFDSIAGYRLSAPFSYWNALGIFAALGGILGLGLTARARSLVVSAAGSASLVIFLPTLYFTFSRGACLALGVGLVSAIAMDPRRLQLIAALVPAIPAALAVWLGSRSGALTHLNAPLTEASRDGHALARWIGVLAVIAAALAIGLRLGERRLSIPPSIRFAFAATVVLALLGVTAAVFVRFGGPSTLARKAYHSVNATEPQTGGDLNKRLFSVASRGRVLQWRAAAHDYAQHRWLGSGAGTYGEYWMQHRPLPFHVRDAHSLYLEQLAEVGPFGLVLLVVTLGAPLVAAVRARRRQLVPVAFGAYVAYLVHAGVDWDWEVPAVTLSGLFCAVAILAAARDDEAKLVTPRMRIVGMSAIAALAAFAFLGLVGNRALADAQSAANSSRWAAAQKDARKAVRWAPWSSEALQELADAQYALGHRGASYRTLLKATRKDPNNWSIWYDAGDVAPTRALSVAAYERAAALNPRSPNIETLRQLGILPKQAR